MSTRVKRVRHGLSKPVVILLSAALLAFLATYSAFAWRSSARSEGNLATSARGATSSPAQGTSSRRNRLLGRLALQPEADRFRRRLGQRFLTAGREVTVWLGTVTQGTERYNARITRTQEEDGEHVTVALNGGQSTLTWNGREGAKAGDQSASGNLRALVERLALDSPDQFVLAQLRGASYFAVAHAARPLEIGSSNNYTGPVWDIIRIDEPKSSDPSKNLGSWRLYYLNVATGLIDKVVSREQGIPLTAEVSRWVSQNGESSPTQIVWKQNQQTVMELSLTNFSQSAKQ